MTDKDEFIKKVNEGLDEIFLNTVLKSGKTVREMRAEQMETTTEAYISLHINTNKRTIEEKFYSVSKLKERLEELEEVGAELLSLREGDHG